MRDKIIEEAAAFALHPAMLLVWFVLLMGLLTGLTDNYDPSTETCRWMEPDELEEYGCPNTIIRKDTP